MTAFVGALIVAAGADDRHHCAAWFPRLYDLTPNPYALDQPLVDPFFGIMTIGVCSLLAAALLLRRFVKSHGVERQQYKWVVLAMSGAVATFFLDTLVRATGNSAIALTGLLHSLSVALVPVAMAIAILRYHLFDIDRVINRTLVYGALTVGLVASYALIVILSQALLDPLFRSGDLQIAVSTLIVATLFQPLRTRIQRMVDRRFNRARYDATQTVAAFVVELRDEVDLDDIERNLQSIVIRTMQPSHVSLWIRPE